jgi:hypothetical protein
MEPNKIENDFKQKLNQREIIPAAAAWDRLDAMLAVAEEKKSKPKWGWLYIAASVLGFLFVGTVFLSQTQEIVDVKRDSVVYENNEIVKPLETLSKEKVTSSVVASISKPKNECKKESKDSNKENDLIKNQKTNNTNETLLAVETLKPDNNVLVSEKENLITGNSKSVVETQTIKVNANDLLSQVDGELDLSFREKVIKSINKNYKSVKVALANRNQQ